MQKITTLSLALTLLLLASACNNNKADTGDKGLTEKKARLEKLKKEKEKTDQEILSLQEEIAKTDTSSSNPSKIKLVSLSTIEKKDFTHFIELQGKVDAENISYIAPRGAPAVVKAVLVRQGDKVKKGQLLLRLDDVLARQGVASARQQAEVIKTRLSLAKDLYGRQKNLWEQGLGTQVELLSRQNEVAALENQLAQVGEGVKTAQEQFNTTSVYSDVNGVADVVNIRVGEMFQGMTAAGPQIKIVNTSNLKVISNIPENYLGTVTKGTAVEVRLPDLDKDIKTVVSFVGASIDAINRGFVVEAKLPADAALKPNQIALMRIRDYSSEQAIAIPLNTLQNDEKGKFVMLASKEAGKLVARKRPVTIGSLSGDLVEIKSGLQAGDALVTEGFASIYDGQQLTTTGK